MKAASKNAALAEYGLRWIAAPPLDAPFLKPLRATLPSSLCAFLRKIFHKRLPRAAFSVVKQDRFQFSGSGLYAWDDGPSDSG